MSRVLIQDVDAWACTGEKGREPSLRRGVSIAVQGRTILAVGQVPQGFVPDEVIDGQGRALALPGLYNAHCHAAMTLQRGWAEDLPFDRWLNERIWVAESALQEQDVYWGAALAACEMIRSGIVAFADHYFWMDQVARVVEESGMKALLAWCLFGGEQAAEVGRATLETTLSFARDYSGAAGGRIRTALGPHSPYMCPAGVLRQVAEQAGQHGLPVHLHLAESERQVQASLDQHGLSPVAHLDALGLLQVPLLAAHCIAVSDGDLELLARGNVTVAHTPKTYMKLGMGMAPLARLLGAGVQVALGTDGPASNSDLSLLEVMRLVGLLQKLEQREAAAMPVGRILHLATAAGARALGFERAGVLAPGAAADLVLLCTDGPHWCPPHDLAAGVVYASHPADVTHVMVDGRLLMRRRELLTLDEPRILDECRRRAARLVQQPMSRMRTYDS